MFLSNPEPGTLLGPLALANNDDRLYGKFVQDATPIALKGYKFMSNAIIERIEAKINQSAGISDESRTELVGLLSTLRSEMTELEKTHGDQAESIAGFAGASTHEAIRDQTNPHLLQLAIDGLSTSVEEVEAEHPKLVEISNAICTMLSNLGI